ncbi:MAG: putative signal transducing protein [Sphingomicrobium sp.]
MSGLVELARFQTRIAADLARLKLESEGIEAILFDAETASIGWGPMMPVRLMVLESDRWLAAKLLEESAG